MYLNEWATENNKEWTRYFYEVSTPRAVHDISAKISPGYYFISESGDPPLTRSGDEQVKMISM